MATMRKGEPNHILLIVHMVLRRVVKAGKRTALKSSLSAFSIRIDGRFERFKPERYNPKGMTTGL
jgi:hypothetical protein